MHSRLRCPIAELAEGSRAEGMASAAFHRRCLSRLEQRGDRCPASSGSITEGEPMELPPNVLALSDAVLPHLHNDTAGNSKVYLPADSKALGISTKTHLLHLQPGAFVAFC